MEILQIIIVFIIGLVGGWIIRSITIKNKQYKSNRNFAKIDKEKAKSAIQIIDEIESQVSIYLVLVMQKIRSKIQIQVNNTNELIEQFKLFIDIDFQTSENTFKMYLKSINQYLDILGDALGNDSEIELMGNFKQMAYCKEKITEIGNKLTEEIKKNQ